MSTPQEKPSLIEGVVKLFLQGNLSVLFLMLALLAGAVALMVTPREEEPQIVVPLADVFIRVPGASAQEVERQVATRLEKMLFQIDGVEYVYSTSMPEMAIVTLRFYVGEDREDSLVKIYNKINSNIDRVPASVAGWVVKPVEIDDVPIVNITLYSKKYDDAELRRLAEEVEIRMQGIQNTNRVHVIGGRARVVRVEFDQARLAARSLSMLEVAQAVQMQNVRMGAGKFDARNEEFLVDAGIYLQGAGEVGSLIVGVVNGKAVRLQEVARVMDAPEEVDSYTRIGFGPAAQDLPDSIAEEARDGRLLTAVNVAVAKKKGTNAVWVADDVKAEMKRLEEQFFPDHVYYRITRNYGQTADAKVNELVSSLGVAIIVVIGMIFLSLGWRQALIIAMAVPVTFSLALLFNYLLGYTINRVTLFALILALGIVVDDPIVCVDNISRHFSMRKQGPYRAVLSAMKEILPPVILTTVAVVASFAPMFFITGMMGPYMRPMALNVPLALCLSTVVALTLTPWLSFHVLKGQYGKEEEAWEVEKSPIYKFYKRFLPFFLNSKWSQWGLIAVVGILFMLAGLLAMVRFVPLKMLPFDNKNEFQIVIDMPEGTTLETTDAATNALADYLRTVPEVVDFQTYVGLSSPMDFNGMVRHYYLREGSNVADIRLNLLAKEQREMQSHAIVLRLRNELTEIAKEHNANVKLVEVPPGPPVIATVTAEVRGKPWHSYEQLQKAAKIVRARMEAEAGVVDVDDSIEDDQVKYVFITDKEKASLTGVSTEQVARTVRLALAGMDVAYLHEDSEVDPLRIVFKLPREQRSSLSDLRRIYVKGQMGNMVTLGEVGQFEEVIQEKAIYHKNLERLVYVYAEMAGRAPAEAILDIQADRVTDTEWDGRDLSALHTRLENEEPIRDFQPEAYMLGGEAKAVEDRTYLHNMAGAGAGLNWTLSDAFNVEWAGEGEWDITITVFRDLGLAFGAACIGIYMLLVYQTGSYVIPLILMISIPLTMIGIMPGFWLLNSLTTRPVGGWENPIFFTATAMIGMIALSGIAVRNAILLIEFVHESLKKDMPLREALIQSGAMRLRPIFLTATTAGLAAIPITLDPIFSGLAWALIFGLVVSTAFTLLLIPVVYWMVYKNHPRGGLPKNMEKQEEEIQEA
ncbi:MAG: efflux RND transporter permease subunit [Candidatus Sumerlaeia bacterium]